MWFPVHGMGPSLLPVLPDEPSTFPAPLLPGPLFRHPSVLRRLRLGHIHVATAVAVADSGGPTYHRYLELRLPQPTCIRQHLDEGKVQKCAMAEDVGLLMVSRVFNAFIAFVAEGNAFSNDFLDDVSPISEDVSVCSYTNATSSTPSTMPPVRRPHRNRLPPLPSAGNLRRTISNKPPISRTSTTPTPRRSGSVKPNRVTISSLAKARELITFAVKFGSPS